MHQLSQIHLFVEFDALEGRTNYKVSQGRVKDSQSTQEDDQESREQELKKRSTTQHN